MQRLLSHVWSLGLAFLVAGCTNPPSVPQFDPQIDGLRLVKLVEGEQAIREINRLHGTTIEVLRGFIAHYENGAVKAAVWVSEAESEDKAAEQIDVMFRKMKTNPRSPFHHYRDLTRNQVPVTAFEGAGQIHYVFRTGKWVYWVSADPLHIDRITHVLQKAK